MSDFNSGDVPSVAVVKDSVTGKLPTFITRSGSTLTIQPAVMADVKDYTMIVILTDTKDTNEYKFYVNVTN
jgi:hypothetical protein